MPVRLTYTYQWKVEQSVLQWSIQLNKVGLGSDLGMKQALMKQELKVIADPKGTAVNLTMVNQAWID